MVVSPDVRRTARLIAIGALGGFVTGVLTVAIVVWKAEPTDTWLRAGARFLAQRQLATGRLEGPVDDDAPVLETRVGTAGERDGPRPTPSISPPPGADLEDRDLAMPVEGLTADRLVRSFDEARGARRHEAIDILAPMGTPVKAVENGRIARLFNSKAGGITIYQFDPGERYCYYYAHLDRYTSGLREGQTVRRGQTIGYVGSTGNASANAPHLHFGIFRLTSERKWWKGEPINPYPVLK
jgi:murein DD-endopeptidase MepM/ murein hydrolase activator NlpD